MVKMRKTIEAIEEDDSIKKDNSEWRRLVAGGIKLKRPMKSTPTSTRANEIVVESARVY